MNRLLPVLIVLLLAGVVANSSLYVISEVERGVVLRFGRMVQTDVPPGLHFKIPFVDDVRKFDGRILTLDAPPESFFTIQRKRLIVDSYAKYRIENVETYYKATGGDEAVALSRLASRVNDGLRNQFGRRTLHEVVSGERELLMKHLMDDLNDTIESELGIGVTDVRVKRIDLPTEVSEPVFHRMIAEREKEARELRSEGKEQAEKISAAAERERTVIEATANSDGERIRGEGDATAAGTYALAYNQDPEFYAFVRSLNAYKASFKGHDNVLLVDPEGDFFKYLNDSKAGL